jgi:DNA-binding GntR family transcriptional regulator
VEQVPLAQRAAASVREAILSGGLAPGTQLVEAEMAEQMKISRAPVREALRVLEEEGLVERIPYKGAFVVRVTLEDIRELYSLRSVIEGYSARLAAGNASPEGVAVLESIVNDMMQAAGSGDLARVTELDLRFHRAVCEMASHRLLLQVWRGLEQKIRLILAMRHRLHREIRDIVEMHRPLLAAIRAGDGDAAAQHMVKHIVDAGEFLLSDPAYKGNGH